MPTEIFGSVEVWNRALWHWLEVIDAGPLLTRNEAAFSSLFGMGESDAGFVPLAARRGLPSDASPAVKRWSEPYQSDDHPAGFFGHTYISCAELASADWQEKRTDPEVHCYGRSEVTGEWIKVGTFRPEPPHRSKPGDVWMEEGVQCRVREISREETLGSDFRLVYDLMICLAQRYGDEHVRLVVWFQEIIKTR